MSRVFHEWKQFARATKLGNRLVFKQFFHLWKVHYQLRLQSYQGEPNRNHSPEAVSSSSSDIAENLIISATLMSSTNSRFVMLSSAASSEHEISKISKVAQHRSFHLIKFAWQLWRQKLKLFRAQVCHAVSIQKLSIVRFIVLEYLLSRVVLKLVLDITNILFCRLFFNRKSVPISKCCAFSVDAFKTGCFTINNVVDKSV
jgi:hypothetical protein